MTDIVHCFGVPQSALFPGGLWDSALPYCSVFHYTLTTKQWADFIPYYLGPCAKWIWARDVLTSNPSSVCAVKMNSIINVNADLIRKVRVFVTYLWTRARFGLFSFNVWSSDFTCSHQGNRSVVSCTVSNWRCWGVFLNGIAILLLG